MSIQKRRLFNQINSFSWNGQIVSQPMEVKKALFQSFEEFDTNNQGSTPFSLINLNWYKISSEENSVLERPFSMEEIWVALRDSNSTKAPGPDGLNAGWLKFMWPHISKIVLKFFQDFYNNGHIPTGANSSFVVLIPKKSN